MLFARRTTKDTTISEGLSSEGSNTVSDMTEHMDTPVTTLLPASLVKKLKASAKRNGRGVSGEIRFILSEALAAKKAS